MREKNSAPHTVVHRSGGGASFVLSSLALLLSALALAGAGFTLYYIFELRQAVDELKASVNEAATASNPVPSTTPSDPPVPSVTTPTTPTPATDSSVGIQPGEFVQAAFGSKARVELLSVKRIQDPETKSRNVVNVQMRVRRVAADNVTGSDIINLGGTTARNPETSETYKAVQDIKRSTGTVSLFSLRENTSADAFVWMEIPEGVSMIDLFVPDTQAFKNVPIAN